MTDSERDALIGEWYRLQKQIKENKDKMAPIVEREMALRKLVAATVFPKPDEGTNKFPMPFDWQLKYTYKIDRKVDQAALPAVQERLRAMNLNPDPLIRDVPELNVKEYRKLTDEQRKVMDTALIITPAAPTLELIAPKP